MTDTENLLPCPWCGEKAKIVTDAYNNHWGDCECGATTSEVGVESRGCAAKVWNTRAESPKEKELIKKLKEREKDIQDFIELFESDINDKEDPKLLLDSHEFAKLKKKNSE